VDRSFSAALPLKRKTRLDPGDLITELRLFVEQSGATVRIDPRMMNQPEPRAGLLGRFATPTERVLFELDGVRLRVQTVHEPFDKRSRIHRFVNPVNWMHGLGEFADHRAHILINEAGIEGEEGPDAVFDRAAAVTATTAVVARLTQPVGAIWTVANNALPMGLFRDGVKQLTDGQAPLRLWMRWHMIPPDEMQEANPGLVTHGLAPFLGREILARPTLVESHRLIEIVFALARRLLDEKLSILETDRVDSGEGTALAVRLRGPGRHNDTPVYEITIPGMEAPPPREPAPDPLALPASAGEQRGPTPEGWPDLPAPTGLPGTEIPSPPAHAAGTPPPDLPMRERLQAPDPEPDLPPALHLDSLGGADAAPPRIPKAPAEIESGDPPRPTADGQTVGPAPEIRDYATAGGRRIRVISGGRTGR